MGRSRGPVPWFVLINLAGVVCVAVLLLRGPFAEFNRVNEACRLQENRLAVKTQNLAGLSDNRERLAACEAALQKGSLLPYEALSGVLEAVTQKAHAFGLREYAFETGEPVAYEAGETGERRIIEIMAEAAYEGDYKDLLRFMEGLSSGACFIRQLTLEAVLPEEGPSRVLLTFSVYGTEEGAP